MSNEEQTYTPALKRKVASEAIEQNKENLDTLAEKYDVPVSLILTWTVTLEKEGENAFKEEASSEEVKAEPRIADEETVELEVSDSNLSESITKGVMADNLNYQRLIFWSVLGTALLIIFVYALFEMFQYNTDVTRERILEDSQYYEINQLRTEAEETLSTFGVVDLEEGVYRIPIDSAINEIANENNSN
jgi:hypothetical protein